MRILIIGDIHGQAEQFDRLLEKMAFSPEQDKLILLGDLIDRGPDSYDVLQRVIRLKRKMGGNMVILRGSHEMLLLSSKCQDKLLWRLVGRSATLRSLKQHGAKVSEYAGWIKENTVPYYEDQYFQCVHAAVRNEPLDRQDDYTLMMSHSLTKKNQYKGKLTVTGHIHLRNPMYFDGFGGKRNLPYGKKGALPGCGVICIDTGCGTKGCPLTGMIIENKEFQLVSAP